MGRPHLTEAEQRTERAAEEWLTAGPNTPAGRVAALLLAVLDSLSRARAELAAVRVATEEARAALRGEGAREERERVVADLMAEALACEASKHTLRPEGRAATCRRLAARYESSAHIAAPKVTRG